MGNLKINQGSPFMAIVYNQIILTGFVSDEPFTVEYDGKDCTFFQIRVKHQCFTDTSTKESSLMTYLVMSSGDRVRGYAQKVRQGDRVKVKGYLATQCIGDSDNTDLMIVSQKIVFLAV